VANHPGRVDLLTLAPDFEEVKYNVMMPLFTATYKSMFYFKYNRITTLTNDDIINLIAYIDCDTAIGMTDGDWCQYMLCNE
jgi:hypothetical protein